MTDTDKRLSDIERDISNFYLAPMNTSLRLLALKIIARAAGILEMHAPQKDEEQWANKLRQTVFEKLIGSV